jgi:hypothetical protein
MSSTFLTYVWHYLLARTLYDELLRPTARGDFSALLILLGLVVLAFCAWRGARRRRV